MSRDQKHKTVKNNDGYRVNKSSIVLDDDVIKNPIRSSNAQGIPFEKEYDRILNRNIQEEYYSADDSVFSAGFNDGQIKKNGAVIDNNDYVNMPFFTSKKIEEKENTSPKDAPDVGEYILMISGKIALIGNINDIENKAKNIVYGDDADHQSIDINDIVILKRISLKIGVFVEE